MRLFWVWVLVMACTPSEETSDKDVGPGLTTTNDEEVVTRPDTGSFTGGGGGPDDVVDTGPVDTDGDGLDDHADNCPLIANRDQLDLDEDGTGDDCDPDIDNDGIPNDHDPFPKDALAPRVAEPGTVYAQTASTLYGLTVATETIVEKGVFKLDPPGSVTDIAIDRYGVLYAITFDDLHICDPISVECWFVGDLTSSSNGLTFVPAGTIMPTQDALVGIGSSGSWNHLVVSGLSVGTAPQGSYGSGYSSSGDSFSIEGLGTFASVNKTGESNDVIVIVDSKTGKVLRELATLSHRSVFGLAGSDDWIYAFDSSGAVIRIDPHNGDNEVILYTSHSWWGAGVRTVWI